MQTISGIPASRGIALGPAFQFLRPHLVVTRYNVQDSMAEWSRFESALYVARQQLAAVQASVRARTVRRRRRFLKPKP